MADSDVAEHLSGSRPVKEKRKHDKPKPWDDDTIDHWKVEPFRPEDNRTGLLQESSFACLFPKYREKYLREAWPSVTRALKEVGIACELNLVEGSMTVKTTRKTYDPFAIIKARDLIKLLSRSVPAAQAVKVLQDDMQCDIVKIGNIIRNKEKFTKRRQRLVGPSGATLKALELLTECYILVQGNTVACMGPYKGLKQVRMIVEDCIRNVHPIYHIKTLMIKRELAKDPALANEQWDRFLPHFKHKNVQRKKPKKVRAKKDYTPFPPPQQPSKVDLQMESGEYFLSKEIKEARAAAERRERQAAKVQARKAEREAAFAVPEEKRLEAAGEADASGERESDAMKLAGKVKLASDGKRSRNRSAEKAADVSMFLDASAQGLGEAPPESKHKSKHRADHQDGDGAAATDKVQRKRRQSHNDAASAQHAATSQDAASERKEKKRRRKSA